MGFPEVGRVSPGTGPIFYTEQSDYRRDTDNFCNPHNSTPIVGRADFSLLDFPFSFGLFNHLLNRNQGH